MDDDELVCGSSGNGRAILEPCDRELRTRSPFAVYYSNDNGWLERQAGHRGTEILKARSFRQEL